MSTHDSSNDPQQETSLSQDGCYVGLTSSPLNLQSVTDRVRSPQAGAIVLFAGMSPSPSPVISPPPSLPEHEKKKSSHCILSLGTTRDSFDGKPVKELQYTAYPALALRTMMDICSTIKTKHGLKGIAMIHRLGVVPIGEESILIAVSAPHRQAAWRAGEDALEECKARVEVWKREEFEAGEGVWRANRDGIRGERVG
ncbi:Molybdopterin biosynthesis MoaE [Chaetomium strumarium]|uniref:Molybdopterin synthase catalytic subunit n=1 Tax=Chaetomium strumarium TaxID=1170767 RepID=A0AAJ0H2X9_9PEZI|nr:Molybdopterin biosynthesis MoaE [Chaetomium strumarium]